MTRTRAGGPARADAGAADRPTPARDPTAQAGNAAAARCFWTKDAQVRTPCLSFAAALTIAVMPLMAIAQASAAAPESGASAVVPLRTKPGPRLLTPIESRGSATQPGDVRPERPVTPQISIPLGKTPPAARTPEPIGAKPNRLPAPVGLEDAVARCEAQAGEQVRAKCRDRLAREARSR